MKVNQKARKSEPANATILLPHPIRTAEHKRFNPQLQGLYPEVLCWPVKRLKRIDSHQNISRHGNDFLPNKALCHTPSRIYVSFAAGKRWFGGSKQWFGVSKLLFAGSKRKNNPATSLASTPSNRAKPVVFHRVRPQPITHFSRWRPQASTRLIKKEEKPL